jgi:hypothetical protein
MLVRGTYRAVAGDALLSLELHAVDPSRGMRRLLGYMRPYRLLVGLSLIFLLVQSGLQVVGPLLTRLFHKWLHPG